MSSTRQAFLPSHAPQPQRPAQGAAPLFRSQALRALHGPGQARVLLRPLVGSGWMALASVLCAAAIVAMLVWGSYTRRATVGGHLAPAAGVVRLVAPVAGWVLEQRVQQGQQVAAGDMLFVLSTDRPTVDGSNFQGRVAESQQRRSALLTQATRQLLQTGTAEREGIQRRIDTWTRERPHLEQQLAEQRRRVALTEEIVAMWRGLLEHKAITREQMLQKEAELSDQRSRGQALERELLAMAREVNEAGMSLLASRTREQQQRQALLQEQEQLRQQTVEGEARRRVVVSAPRAGTLTLVHVGPGMAVDAQRALAQLMPADEPLVVRLFAPSRAVGFVQPGTEVWLRYEAFPYGRYGMQRAEVVAVSSTPANVDELSPWLGGPGVAGGAAAGEPLYQITARMLGGRFDSQVGPVALRAGLRVEADLRFERRRLFEWVLGPALQLQQRGVP